MPGAIGSFIQQLPFYGLINARAMVTPVALGVVAMIVNRDGHVLLAKHSYQAGWMLPGGGVNRGEPPEHAVLREMHEEMGTLRSDTPELVGIFTRRALWATNVVVLYRLMNAEVDFTPNFEVREIRFVDPADLPPDTTTGTRRRLAEYVEKRPPSLYW